MNPPSVAMEHPSARPQFSLAALLGVLVFTAAGIAAFVARTRPVVSVLATETILAILFGLVAMLRSDRSRKPFWTGFAVFSLGYFFFVGGVTYSDFHSGPAVLAEWASGPEDVYFDWPPKTGDPCAGLREPTRDRIRLVANCMASIYLGLIGGYVAERIARNAGRRREETAPLGHATGADHS